MLAGLKILVVTLVLSIPLVAVIVTHISKNRDARETAIRYAEYEKLFTPDRRIYIYSKMSDVFDLWDLYAVYKILKYKDGHVLCHRLATDDEKPYNYKGYVPDEIKLDHIIRWHDRVALMEEKPFFGKAIRIWENGKLKQ